MSVIPFEKPAPREFIAVFEMPGGRAASRISVFGYCADDAMAVARDRAPAACTAIQILALTRVATQDGPFVRHDIHAQAVKATGVEGAREDARKDARETERESARGACGVHGDEPLHRRGEKPDEPPQRRGENTDEPPAQRASGPWECPPPGGTAA